MRFKLGDLGNKEPAIKSPPHTRQLGLRIVDMNSRKGVGLGLGA